MNDLLKAASLQNGSPVDSTRDLTFVIKVLERLPIRLFGEGTCTLKIQSGMALEMKLLDQTGHEQGIVTIVELHQAVDQVSKEFSK